MNEERVLQIVRQFPENGLKQVLTSPQELTGPERLRRLEHQRRHRRFLRGGSAAAESRATLQRCRGLLREFFVALPGIY